ncbi:MAG: 3-oxoacyl-[acyl-carrier-protein] synthase-3 [Polyangiales bacterium]|jgi:3-oxoacyl-[acyl-carrier-protein] synthase-3
MSSPIRVRIAGVGHYLPKRVVPSSELEPRLGVEAGWIERRSGVSERRWASAEAGESNSWMGAQAALEACADAGIEPADIDLIINASGTPEQTIPDGAPLIQVQLGLGESGIPCMSIHTTCISFLHAFDVASSLLMTHAYQRILIVSAEVASVALNFEERESASLFGDAAAAVVMEASGEHASAIHRSHFATYGVGAHFTEVPGGGSRLHPNHPDSKPSDQTFHMQGKKVLRLALRNGVEFLETLSPGLSKGLGDIDCVIPHQASRVGLRVFGAFGWPNDRIVTTLAEVGNCVAASIPYTLYRAIKSGKLKRGERFLLFGTGAGLSYGGIVATY